jgi:hypothetical protein
MNDSFTAAGALKESFIASPTVPPATCVTSATYCHKVGLQIHGRTPDLPTLRLCPALRKGKLTLRVARSTVSGVYGALYRPGPIVS